MIRRLLKTMLIGNHKKGVTPAARSKPRPYEYSAGRGTYGDPTVYSWGEGAGLHIGNFCSIAEGVKIFLGGEHRMDWVTTFPFNRLRESARHFTGHPRTKGDVVIGNDVWIGMDAVIMSGVTIGDGAVIGARALITKNVDPYAIVAGNPARLIKHRFAHDVIESLLAIKWWDWSDAEIDEMMPFILNSNIQAFIAEAENRCRGSAKKA